MFSDPRFIVFVSIEKTSKLQLILFHDAFFIAADRDFFESSAWKLERLRKQLAQSPHTCHQVEH